ncbi:Susd and RagB outer membrane lipoprotein [Flavobacteriaceae bacterium MAR_2010_188]|nr:Susd and RagB outer membrane lipoprotein [Flavobacteriaceae bacterium MAR_2010_188]
MKNIQIMKKPSKIIFIAFLSALTFFQGCETIELEKLQSPNALGPDQADPTLLFNSIQLNYRNGVTTYNNIGADLSRIEYMFGRVYYDNYPGNTLNGPWNALYSGIIPDLQSIEDLNDEGQFDFLVGASKAMEAHLLMLTVDYVGDAVFTEANKPAEFPAPMLDNGASVYESALGLLDEATALLTDSSLGTATDLYYGGSSANWIKFVNTLKMRAALTTKDYQGVVNATNVIETADDNMFFAYGTNELEPDTRHPDYIDDYTASGANNYRSNWLMELMIGEAGDITGDDDPRRRYYFYRQDELTPGSFTYLLFEGNGSYYEYPAVFGQSSVDAQNLVCSSQDVPNHLQFTEEENYWCSNRLGYWGRIHGNAEGTPPDNFLRTASGVYPAGGLFDDNLDYVVLSADQEDLTLYDAGVGLGLGAGGNGIEPIILSSYVEFWRAEAYLMLDNTAMAEEHFTAGVTESIEYVMTFGPKDPTADLSFAPSEERVQEFIENITDEFSSAARTTAVDANGYPVEKDKMDILGEQYFIALYGAGADGYNFVRRTGYPRTLARNIDANSGTFPRTLLYPSDEVLSNPNINQRVDNATKVFWDSGVTNPAN